MHVWGQILFWLRSEFWRLLGKDNAFLFQEVGAVCVKGQARGQVPSESGPLPGCAWHEGTAALAAKLLLTDISERLCYGADEL